MTFDPATCQAIDTEIAAAYRAHFLADLALTRAVDAIHDRAGNERKRRGGRVHPEWTIADALAAIVADETSGKPRRVFYSGTSETLAADLAAARTAATAARAEYDRQAARYQGWPRFFVVTSSAGHIHSSMSCSTCYPSTTYGWLPQLSGLDEAAAVADQGSMLCTICYPSAPAEYTDGSRLGRDAQAERDRIAAERDARNAARLAKAIAADGSTVTIPTTHGTERVTTIHATKAAATDCAADMADSYLVAHRPELVEAAAHALTVICSLLADRCGTTADAEHAAAVKRAARR